MKKRFKYRRGKLPLVRNEDGSRHVAHTERFIEHYAPKVPEGCVLKQPSSVGKSIAFTDMKKLFQ